MALVANTNINSKRKFMLSGLFKAEVNSFLSRELSHEGYTGVEVRDTGNYVEIIILAILTHEVLGERCERINSLTAVITRRFQLDKGTVAIYVEKVPVRGLCAATQIDCFKLKLFDGFTIKRAAYAALRYVMNSGAEGCEIRVAGKVGGQRAKALKFSAGKMIHAGGAVHDFIDSANTQVRFRQGVVGVKISIMLPMDFFGKKGPPKSLPDEVKVVEPKPEEPIEIRSVMYDV